MNQRQRNYYRLLDKQRQIERSGICCGDCGRCPDVVEGHVLEDSLQEKKSFVDTAIEILENHYPIRDPITGEPIAAPSQSDQAKALKTRMEDSLEEPKDWYLPIFEVPAESVPGFVERHPNSQRYHDLLVEAGELHDKKQSDYGRGDDPFANVRSSEEWGIAGWIGAMIRLNDKVRRLQTLASKGSLANEAAIDSFMDIAVYALIARVLYEQGMEE